MPEKLAQPKKKKPSDTMTSAKDKEIKLVETRERLRRAECAAKGGEYSNGKCK